MEQSCLHWIALYTRARHEKKIVERLNEIEVEAYVPLWRKLRQWSDRSKWVEVPLIPSYVFVHIHFSEYLRLLTMPGVVRAVTFNGRIACIRDHEIELLRRVVQCEHAVVLTGDEFQEGDEAEITGGLFAGHRGKVISTDNKYRVRINIEELSTSIIVEVLANDVHVFTPSVVEVKQ